MTNPDRGGYYNRIRHNSPNQRQLPPNQKKSSRINLPFVSILANHKDYKVHEVATGPVLKCCKPARPQIV